MSHQPSYPGGIALSIGQRRKRFHKMAETLDIAPALRLAGKDLTLSEHDQVWDDAVLLRYEIREAFNTAGLTAQHLAEKLKQRVDEGELRAIELAFKLCGYLDPLPKQPAQRGGNHDERGKRGRIIDLLGIRDYPLPETEAGNGDGEEGEYTNHPEALHPSGDERGSVEGDGGAEGTAGEAAEAPATD